MTYKGILAAAVCIVSFSAAEPPPSYLPPYDLTAPAPPAFSGYAPPKPEYGAPPPKPVYSAPAPKPVYRPTAAPRPAYSPPPSPVYGAPSPRPTYSPPRRTYSKPKPVRYSPPAPAPVYAAPTPSREYLPAPSAPSSSNYLGHGQQQQEYYSEPANYMFQYAVQDPHYGADFGHKESREGDVAHGQYMVLLPDGRRQIVEYVADENGYQPTIRYEGETGRLGSSGGGY